MKSGAASHAFSHAPNVFGEGGRKEGGPEERCAKRYAEGREGRKISSRVAKMMRKSIKRLRSRT